MTPTVSWATAVIHRRPADHGTPVDVNYREKPTKLFNDIERIIHVSVVCSSTALYARCAFPFKKKKKKQAVATARGNVQARDQTQATTVTTLDP